MIALLSSDGKVTAVNGLIDPDSNDEKQALSISFLSSGDVMETGTLDGDVKLDTGLSQTRLTLIGLTMQRFLIDQPYL